MHAKSLDNMMFVQSEILKQRLYAVPISPGSSSFDDGNAVKQDNTEGLAALARKNGNAGRVLGVSNVKWIPTGPPLRSGLHRIATSAGEFKDALKRSLGSEEAALDHSTRKERCMSCYRAKSDPDACCNTCEELREAFKERGWEAELDSGDKAVFEQCSSDEEWKKNPPQEHEGCRVTAEFTSRKVFLEISTQFLSSTD